MTLSLVPSAGAAGLALILAVVVGMRGEQRLANVSLTLSMLGLAVTEAGHWLMLRGAAYEPGVAISGLAELAGLPAWTVFGIVFGAADPWARLRRWWWMVGLTTATVVGLGSLSILGPLARREMTHGGVLVLLTPLGKAATVTLLLVSVFVLFQLEATYRSASGGGRRRVTYFMLALFGLVGSNIFGLSQQLLHGQILVSRFALQSAMTLASLGLMAAVMARHRLGVVGIVVSRQAVYHVVAVGVVGTYLLALGLAGEVTERLGLTPDLFVTGVIVFLSAMALLAGFLSEGVRAWVKGAISRHFYRSKYDYRREWAEFTAHVSNAGSPDLLPERILDRVTGTLGARTGALWLHDPDARWRLAASVGPPSAFPGMDPETLVRSGGRANGMRTLVLEANGEVGGLLAVGEPRRGPLGPEDEELLATLASQSASVLLNARLSEQLSRAREMEAIHRLAAFVLHDLKNCVAMLSLVSQNAATHGDKPEFRGEAFRAVGESVRQMQALMSKLSDPLPESQATAGSSRINKLVEEIVGRARIGPGGAADIRTDLDSSADTVAVAAEALHTILSNLILNAVEAVESHGRIEVSTMREGDRVTVAVADTGRGMSEEFVRDQLFVPGRSTKANGLGVGLYQVKSLVESTGGRIRVASRQGRGTTFWVDLPIAEERR